MTDITHSTYSLKRFNRGERCSHTSTPKINIAGILTLLFILRETVLCLFAVKSDKAGNGYLRISVREREQAEA